MMPLPLCWMVIQDRLTLMALVTEIPLPDEFWMVPPVPAEPVPATVRPPELPVLLSRMPLTAPFDEMRLNVRLLAPIVVLSTCRAVPDVVARVLLEPVTLT